MLPKLEKLEPLNQYTLFQTTDQVRGLALTIKPCDTEAEDEELYVDRLSQFFRTLNPSLRIRFLSSNWKMKSLSSNFPRMKALLETCARDGKVICVIEKSEGKLLSGLALPSLKPKAVSNETSELLLEAARSLKDLGFETEPLSQDEVQELFIDDISDWISDIGSVETGSKSMGVIRMVKPTSRGITPRTLCDSLKAVSHDYEIRVCLERLSATSTEILLQRRLKQTSRESRVGDMQSEALEDTLVATSLSGVSLLNYEFLVVIEKPTKKELRLAMKEIAQALKALGDFSIETLGCGTSLVCSYPGSQLHVPVLEQESTLPCFMPLFRVGEAEEFKGSEGRAVSFLREDLSVSHLDLLDTRHQNQNAVIVGTSGKGKSVALGVLTHSLLQDEAVSIIKVDVGGSHSRECEMMGGTEFKLRIDRPSGLNPFSLLSNDGCASEADRSVLAQFLEVLILEDGEKRLTKAMRAELDRAIELYLCVKHKSPSLDDFVEKCGNAIPRRALLERWTGTGLYANAFRDLPGTGKSAVANSDSSQAGLFESSAEPEFASTRKRQATQLRYINFSEVFQASDPEFSTAAMAAVLAMFNLELKLNPERRLVLVVDECPFFIEKCFEFFKFSTANVRKFGASVVLVVQLSKHLVVGGDTGVIENSSHRLLFSVDGANGEFMERMKLSEEMLEKLLNLKPKAKESKFLYQYQDIGKLMTLRLTPQEYWRLTSSQNDRLLIDSLVRYVPDLKMDEAIEVLSRNRMRKSAKPLEMEA